MSKKNVKKTDLVSALKKNLLRRKKIKTTSNTKEKDLKINLKEKNTVIKGIS